MAGADPITTQRRREAVLSLAADGHSYRAIAAFLGTEYGGRTWSPTTVKNDIRAWAKEFDRANPTARSRAWLEIQTRLDRAMRGVMTDIESGEAI